MAAPLCRSPEVHECPAQETANRGGPGATGAIAEARAQRWRGARAGDAARAALHHIAGAQRRARSGGAVIFICMPKTGRTQGSGNIGQLHTDLRQVRRARLFCLACMVARAECYATNAPKQQPLLLCKVEHRAGDMPCAWRDRLSHI